MGFTRKRPRNPEGLRNGGGRGDRGRDRGTKEMGKKGGDAEADKAEGGRRMSRQDDQEPLLSIVAPGVLLCPPPPPFSPNSNALRTEQSPSRRSRRQRRSAGRREGWRPWPRSSRRSEEEESQGGTRGTRDREGAPERLSLPHPLSSPILEPPTSCNLMHLTPTR